MIILFTVTSLFGMEMPSQKSILQTIERNGRLQVGHKSLQDGIDLYNQGKFQDARHLLLGGYYRVEKYDPQLLSIDPKGLNLIYNAITKTQLGCEKLSKTHIDRAITFAHKTKKYDTFALTEVGLTLTKKATKAAEEKNYALENICNKKAFSLFEQERNSNPIAKQFYDYALCYGIGCTYNPEQALPNFLTQLKHNRHQLKTTSDLDQTITYITHFADNGNMRSQCILVRAYMRGEHGLIASHQKALYYCEQFILKFATIPSLDLLPMEYFIIPITLKQLSFTDKKAGLLNAYYNILYAYKTNNYKKIADICSRLYNANVAFLFLKLFCTNGSDSLINFDKVKSLTLDNKDFKDFCDSEVFDLTLKLLELKLASLENQNNSKVDAIHYSIGLCEYYKKHYTNAHAHFIQCLSYKNDLYTQALILETSTNENSLEIAESIIPLLKIASQYSQPRYRDEKAKQIIADIFNYVHQKHVTRLLRNQKYTQAYRFIYCLTQLEKTCKAACSDLIKIEQYIAEESEENYIKLTQIPTRLDIYHTLETIVTQKNHDENICDTLAYLSREQIKHTLTDDTAKKNLQKKCLSFLTCTFNHSCRSENYKNSMLSTCGNLAYDLGMSEQSIDYLEQAISFGNEQALYAKAMLLAGSPLPGNHESEIKYLLEKHTHSNDPNRIESIKELAEHYFHLPGLDNAKQTLYYLNSAEKMNNHDLNPLLADFYLKGIEEEDGTWYLQPNEKKALQLLNEHIALDNKKFSAQSLFMRAVIYYKKNELKKAFEDLENRLQFPLSDEQTSISLWLMGIIKMLEHGNNPLTTEIVNFFRLANCQLLKVHNLEIQAMNCLISHTDKRAFLAIEEKINHILSENYTDFDSIDFCFIMGKLYFASTQMAPITDKNRLIAIASLKHAAENNHFTAPLVLCYAEDEELDLCNKIYYLEKILQLHPHLPDLIEDIQSALNDLYPTNIESQAHLINYYAEKKNDELLKKYLSSIYENNSPIANKSLSDDEGIKLIDICSKNALLIKSTHDFIENPKKSIPLEHFAAMFYGSLLSYSLDQNQLIKGAKLLETARNNFPLQLEHIEINLSKIYYKLGWRYTQTESYKPALAMLYLQKSASLKNIDAMILLGSLWLDKTPEIRSNIDTNIIFEYVSNAHFLEKSDRTYLLLQRYEEQKNQSSKRNCIATKLKIKKTLAGMTLIDQQQKHPAYLLLVHSSTSPEAGNEELQKAINLINSSCTLSLSNEAIAIFQKLAKQNPPHPHACIQLALCFSRNQSMYGLVKQRLQETFDNGLIKSPVNPNAQFKDATLINSVFQFIDFVVFGEKQTLRTITLLQQIKKNLVEKKVNINAFEILFEFSYGKNLTRHRGWK